MLEIKSFVSELMQYGADETVVEEMIQKADRQPVLRQKLTDIKKIYKAFVEYLSQNYITSEEILTVLTKVTKESEILKDAWFVWMVLPVLHRHSISSLNNCFVLHEKYIYP